MTLRGNRFLGSAIHSCHSAASSHSRTLISTLVLNLLWGHIQSPCPFEVHVFLMYVVDKLWIYLL